MAITLNLTEIIQPQPKQKSALDLLFDPKVKYLLYGGAMAGGKSYVLRWAAFSYLYYIYCKYNLTGVVVGLFSEDYPTLKDRQISRIKREFPKFLGELKDTRDEGHAFYMHKKYGEGKILLRNLDDPSKYMSTEFAGEFVDEMSRNNEQVFEDLRDRLRWPGIDEVKFMGATNPGGVGHGWAKKLFVDRNSDDPEQDRFFYVHANAYDNKFISQEYIKQLEALPEQKRKAYLEGSWDVFAGQYYSEFKRSAHVVSPFIPNPKFQVIVGGMDWGRIDNFAFYLAAISKLKYNGTSFYRAKVFLECYGTEKMPSEWSEKIAKKIELYNLKFSDIAWIRADTQIWSELPIRKKDGSALDIYSQFTQVNDGWLKLRRANKDRVGGWENLHKWLSIAPDGLPYLQFTTEASNLIRTLPQLVYSENKREKKEDIDQGGEDDGPDALRYMMMSLKWIDGNVGRVDHTFRRDQILKKAPIGYIGEFTSGKQVGIDLEAFSTPTIPQGDVGGIKRA